jgi:hypothetical protein
MPRISFQEEDLKKENDTTSPTEGGKPEEVSLTKYGKLKKFVFDAYAVRESPTTLAGVFVTVLVICEHLSVLLSICCSKCGLDCYNEKCKYHCSGDCGISGRGPLPDSDCPSYADGEMIMSRFQDFVKATCR